jgi:hypothetical protein
MMAGPGVVVGRGEKGDTNAFPSRGRAKQTASTQQQQQQHASAINSGKTHQFSTIDDQVGFGVSWADLNYSQTP